VLRDSKVEHGSSIFTPSHRLANPGSNLQGEEAHTLERLLVGDARQASLEAEVLVGRLCVEPGEVLGELCRKSYQSPKVGPAGLVTMALPPLLLVHPVYTRREAL
jgi:hypothetical protein